MAWKFCHLNRVKFVALLRIHFVLLLENAVNGDFFFKKSVFASSLMWYIWMIFPLSTISLMQNRNIHVIRYIRKRQWIKNRLRQNLDCLFSFWIVTFSVCVCVDHSVMLSCACMCERNGLHSWWNKVVLYSLLVNVFLPLKQQIN